MSRKYCSVCGKTHQNGGLGMCDFHINQEEYERNEEDRKEEDQINHFMSLDDEDKWGKVFDFMRSKGWDVG